LDSTVKNFGGEKQEREAGEPPLSRISEPLAKNYWLSGVIPAGHSGGAGAGATPVESDWMTPDPSEQKLRCPVVPTLTGHAIIV
jgi:hypothetical protein